MIFKGDFIIELLGNRSGFQAEFFADSKDKLNHTCDEQTIPSFRVFSFCIIWSTNRFSTSNLFPLESKPFWRSIFYALVRIHWKISPQHTLTLFRDKSQTLPLVVSPLNIRIKRTNNIVPFRKLCVVFEDVWNTFGSKIYFLGSRIRFELIISQHSTWQRKDHVFFE
jgi:hypothetical protein